jgi:hypothetical protein
MPRKNNSGKNPPTIEQIKDTLEKCAGYQNKAARAMGVSAAWLSMKINSTPELKELRDELMELKIDVAEETLEQRIKDKSDTALIFFLRTKARHRGYSQDVLTENNLSAIKEYLNMQRANSPIAQEE